MVALKNNHAHGLYIDSPPGIGFPCSRAASALGVEHDRLYRSYCVWCATCMIQNHLPAHEPEIQCAGHEIRIILFIFIWFNFNSRENCEPLAQFFFQNR